jgi:hypothetical protein
MDWPMARQSASMIPVTAALRNAVSWSASKVLRPARLNGCVLTSDLLGAQIGPGYGVAGSQC